VVILTDVLEHLLEPDRLLFEARRVLRSGGFAVISVPNHFYLKQRFRILAGHGVRLPWEIHQKYQDWNYCHVRFFRWSSLLDLLRATGFSPETDLSDRFFAPFPLPLRIPIVKQLTQGLRHLTRYRLRGLWTLHFLLIARPE
jgi:SAM-dependent methyltransferase